MKNSEGVFGVRLGDVLKKYNPFALKKEDGTVMMFKSYVEAYQELLQRMYDASQKGYFDIPLFIVENYGMTLPFALQFLLSYFGEVRIYMEQDESWQGEVLIRWDRLIGRDYYCLCSIVTGFHWITETKFNKDMFNYALDMFQTKNNLHGREEKKSE